MTKKELLKALENWPDDAVIEFSVTTDLDDSEEPDTVWYRIDSVEQIRNECWLNNHCLLYAGKHL